MSSALRYCEGVMEAAWLTALVSVPLFHNVWGESIESEKNHLLRALAIVLATAWAIRFVLDGRFTPERVSSISVDRPRRTLTPLNILLGLLGLSFAVSTVLSLNPQVSFWGAPGRRLGSSSFFCCLLFFGAILTHARSARQLERIITAIVLASVPISVYAIGQRFSIEPIIRAEGPHVLRVGSTFAHSIYLGAYLIMVLPLTLTRVLSRNERFGRNALTETGDRRRAALYSLIAGLQLCALAFTVSRGPILGLVGGGGVAALLLAVYFRKRQLVRATLWAGLAVIASLALLCLPFAPFRTLAQRPDVQRFLEILEPRKGSSGRAAIWDVAVQTSKFSKVVETMDGRPDELSRWRWLVGYGPENAGPPSRLHAGKEYIQTMGDGVILDRFHNEFWDALITTGFAGWTITLALTLAVLYWPCQTLGLIPTPQARSTFFGFVGGGASFVGLALSAWQGFGFIGIAIPLGAIFGLMGFLIHTSGRNDFHPDPLRLPTERSFLVIALSGAFVAHLIEVSFCFIFETSLLYFWTCLAVLFAIGLRPLPSESPLGTERASKATPLHAPLADAVPPPPSSSEGNPSETSPDLAARFRTLRTTLAPCREEIVSGLLAALVLFHLGFLLIQKTGVGSTFQTMVDSLTRLPGNKNAFTWGPLLAVPLIWIVVCATTALESCRGPRPQARHRPLALVMSISGLLGLIYWLVLAGHKGGMISYTEVLSETLDSFLRQCHFITDFHYAATLLFSIPLLALFLADPPAAPPSGSRRSWLWLRITAALLAAAVGVVAVRATSMRWSHSGGLQSVATELNATRPDQWELARKILERVIRDGPRLDSHYVSLGKVLMAAADKAPDPTRRRELLIEADQLFQIGSQLSPFAPSFLVRRGNLSLKRAEAEASPAERIAFGKKALEFYARAAAVDPSNRMLWLNMAFVNLALLNAPDEALRSVEHSLELVPDSHQAFGLMADAFTRKATASLTNSDRPVFLRLALTNYITAHRLIGTNGPDKKYRYGVGIGKSLYNLGQIPRAITAYQSVATLAPPAERWRNEEILARLYSDAQDKTNALEHLRRAALLAPPDKQSGLNELQNQILSRQ